LSLYHSMVAGFMEDKAIIETQQKMLEADPAFQMNAIVADAPLVHCPACNADALVKRVSAAGFQLKGSGWYATDFKGGGSKPAEKKDGAETKGEAKSAAAMVVVARRTNARVISSPSVRFNFFKVRRRRSRQCECARPVRPAARRSCRRRSVRCGPLPRALP